MTKPTVAEVMTVRVYGQLVDITGADRVAIALPANTDALLTTLFTQFPALSAYSFKVAVNHHLVSGTVPLSANEEVALLPPFSGG